MGATEPRAQQRRQRSRDRGGLQLRRARRARAARPRDLRRGASMDLAASVQCKHSRQAKGRAGRRRAARRLRPRLRAGPSPGRHLDVIKAAIGSYL